MKDERGQTMAEYALVLTMLSFLAAGITALSGGFAGLLERVSDLFP